MTKSHVGHPCIEGDSLSCSLTAERRGDIVVQNFTAADGHHTDNINLRSGFDELLKWNSAPLAADGGRSM
eukprot:6194398-Pleurochrysis_carterae.AAC.2